SWQLEFFSWQHSCSKQLASILGSLEQHASRGEQVSVERPRGLLRERPAGHDGLNELPALTCQLVEGILGLATREFGVRQLEDFVFPLLCLIWLLALDFAITDDHPPQNHQHNRQTNRFVLHVEIPLPQGKLSAESA